jgi:integrase
MLCATREQASCWRKVRPRQVVSEVLGHSSISITADVYAHLFEGQKRDAAEAMTVALFG